MSKKFLAGVIVKATEMPTIQASGLASDIIEAIKSEIVETGRYTIPDFGAFIVRKTAKRTALNPRTGEKIAVKAGATVRFKASPALKAAALAGMRKTKRKASKA
ncbi:HU family DNA-binding protein [Paeniroseomonas aquatica]|uniref:HU family DNA-binding protein n=1 Tax=Paeniroseomonas aquatica TaxID=373043 RepID=A0ABT7ZZX2_9PROT|nr:HU family DNA-binding protein [Paeniroseomonas aquatica]MDN3563019.1 HU family DNA-binding protein [Paeniroseomonas aquatica]